MYVRRGFSYKYNYNIVRNCFCFIFPGCLSFLILYGCLFRESGKAIRLCIWEIIKYTYDKSTRLSGMCVRTLYFDIRKHDSVISLISLYHSLESPLIEVHTWKNLHSCLRLEGNLYDLSKSASITLTFLDKFDPDYLDNSKKAIHLNSNFMYFSKCNM